MSSITAHIRDSTVTSADQETHPKRPLSPDLSSPQSPDSKRIKSSEDETESSTTLPNIWEDDPPPSSHAPEPAISASHEEWMASSEKYGEEDELFVAWMDRLAAQQAKGREEAEKQRAAWREALQRRESEWRDGAMWSGPSYCETCHPENFEPPYEDSDSGIGGSNGSSYGGDSSYGEHGGDDSGEHESQEEVELQS